MVYFVRSPLHEKSWSLHWHVVKSPSSHMVFRYDSNVFINPVPKLDNLHVGNGTANYSLTLSTNSCSSRWCSSTRLKYCSSTAATQNWWQPCCWCTRQYSSRCSSTSTSRRTRRTRRCRPPNRSEADRAGGSTITCHYRLQ